MSMDDKRVKVINEYLYEMECLFKNERKKTEQKIPLMGLHGVKTKNRLQ
jgi:hypothetical protein